MWIGAKSSIFLIRMNQSMNNLNRIYTQDVAEYARRYFKYLKEILDSIDPESIAQFVDLLLDARARNANIFFVGNGGSAATASHFANDLGVGTRSYARPFRAISLTDNLPVITALANDYGYEEIFVRQLKILGRNGDILIAISASGNSPNLVEAMEYASNSKITTVAITAFDGGKMKKIANMGIHVPTKQKEYGPAEDAHMVLDHLVSGYLMRYIKNG